MKRKNPLPGRNTGSSGQVLGLVLIILLVVSTLVPLMVLYTQRESRWTAKQAANTRAFHLAEAGIEKGYLAISLSTSTWVDLQNGTLPVNYKFDKAYNDIPGGQYAISITSGPGSQQATIISVGRDSIRQEIRAIKAVYSNSPLGGIALYSGAGAKVSNKVNVEWGSIVSPLNLTLTGANTTDRPQFWSAGSIDIFDTDPSPPNCDGPACCQWHSYATNIPPSPLIDFEFYKSSAAAQTGCHTGGSPAGSCYYPSGLTLSSNLSATNAGGKTYYIDGNFDVGTKKIGFIGNMIVMGNFSTGSGTWGNGDRTMSMPQDAWKQYCNSWTHYQTFDASAPSSFPGVNATYLSADTLTHTVSGKVAISGFLYVQGNMTIGTGNGNTDIHGVMYVVGTTTMAANSDVTLWYDKSVSDNIKTTQIVLSRVSWQDVLTGWPGGL